MPGKLQNCVVTPDNMINDEGELIRYTFYANTKPMNLTKELKDPIWMNAMIQELNHIEVNKSQSHVDLPHGKEIIGVKWVYNVKLSPNSGMIIHKARLMAKGFLQIEDIDFDEVYALIAIIQTIRLVISLDNINNLINMPDVYKVCISEWLFR